MRTTTNLGFEIHLKSEETEKGKHHDDPGHGRIVIDQDIWKTWVAQGGKSRGNELSFSSASGRDGRQGWPGTWANAVAISTPVPKCLQAKNMGMGILNHLIFFAATGNPAPYHGVSRVPSYRETDDRPATLARKTMTRCGQATQGSFLRHGTYRLQPDAVGSRSCLHRAHRHRTAASAAQVVKTSSSDLPSGTCNLYKNKIIQPNSESKKRQ